MHAIQLFICVIKPVKKVSGIPCLPVKKYKKCIKSGELFCETEVCVISLEKMHQRLRLLAHIKIFKTWKQCKTMAIFQQITN